MTDWVFLSDRDQPVQGRLPERLDQATLVIELSWPLPTGVLMDWQGPEGCALSLFHHPQSGLGLLWREATVLRRFLLPGPLRLDGRLGRLVFRWNNTENIWAMSLDDRMETTAASTYGLGSPAFSMQALARMCAGTGLTRRDSSVLWFGVTAGQMPPRGMAWVGLNTPVPTVEGMMPAGRLRPGQWILTQDAGPVRLKSLRRMDMPSRGSHAAVVLRAPFHGWSADILVSSDQLVRVSGLEAEYLFGEAEVLVAAGALVDGSTALTDNRRATTLGVSLDLGQLHLIDVGGCVLMTGHHGPASTMPILPLRALHDYEALPLMGLLRRMKPSDAA
jgi:Hint domain